MKNIHKYLAIGASMFLAVSCVDLDTSPEGSNIKDDQKQAILQDDPTQIDAEINGMNAILIYCGADSSGDHSDFGYPSISLYMDHNGPDMVAIEAGYNHYMYDSDFTGRLYGGYHPYFTWRTLYDYVDAANNIINITSVELENEENQDLFNAARGHALAGRAWAYHTLVQLYQFKYVGNEDKLGVPLVYSTSELEGPDGLLAQWGIDLETYIRNGERRTVREVYQLITSDIDAAVELLEGTSFSRANKSFISLSVAYGIRARVNLTMENWIEAAADAESAISAANNEGIRLLSRDAVSEPTFNDQSVSSVMWAAVLGPQNRAATTGIINFTSMICSFYRPGYAAGGGVLRKVSKLLFDVIPTTDVRRGWWLDANNNSPNLPEGVTSPATAYANIKFAPYENDYSTTTAAVDYIMMRLEEMELIRAEALAMSGSGDGVTKLNDWVTTYRDPSYAFASVDRTEIQNEVWKHRRIEFWGEGITWFDIMRLEKPVLRFIDEDTNFDDRFKFNVPADSEIKLWRITSSEISANEGLNESDNAGGDIPLPSSGSEIRNDGVVFPTGS